MRRSLEQTLTGVYHDIAKAQIEQENQEDVTAKEKAELQTVLDWHVRDKAEQRSKERSQYQRPHLVKRERSQREILAIQKRKQELVDWLEAERIRLNDPDYHPEKSTDSREVVYEDGKYYVINPGGEKIELTLGEIITDYELGINYYLNPDSVPKAVRKKYIFETTKKELQDLLDEQIILDEIGNLNFGGEGTVKRKNNIIKSPQENKGSEGAMAEIMVSNFLEKLSWDFNADFKLIRTDVYEDHLHKIDFAIRRKMHYRGIKVEGQVEAKEESDKSRLGIQFTIGQSKELLRKKRHQLMEMREKIGVEIDLDDVVLVSVPLKDLSKVFFKWFSAGKPSGGPDKLWDRETKQAIIAGVLQGMMTEEEIRELQEKIV